MILEIILISLLSLIGLALASYVPDLQHETPSCTAPVHILQVNNQVGNAFRQYGNFIVPWYKVLPLP